MRLLVVEDYATLRESLARGLRDTGYAVDATGDGTEGLWFAQNNPYDVIILDLMLPGLSGTKILEQLRKSGNTVHVLVLTARDSIADRVATLDLGADDYLVKPFAFEELAARLRALVRRKYERNDHVIRVADLEVDTVKRAAKRDGEVIPLSAREYALLEYLANRAGHVVTRSELWEHVYDFAAEPARLKHSELDRITLVGARLRLRSRAREQRARCLHQSPAPQDRRRPRHEADPHQARPRLRARH